MYNFYKLTNKHKLVNPKKFILNHPMKLNARKRKKNTFVILSNIFINIINVAISKN